MLPVETDVLIVGAGPTGLTLAASLSLLGVDHVLIDGDAGPHAGSKAAGVQPHTLEYLGRLGVAEGLVADGLLGQGFRVQDGERTLLRVPYHGLDTPFPFLLLIPQRVTEAHLERRLIDLGGAIHRRHQLISWQPAFPGVCAIVAGPDGTLRAVFARYLVGCDGVHSAVRATAGIPFPGDDPQQLYALAEVRLTGDPNALGANEATYFLAEDGSVLTVPLPGGLHRIVASVPADTPPLLAREIEALLAARAGGGAARWRVGHVADSSTYRHQQGVAARFSQGSLFLAGDAAHTHSPRGAQGMNTGIQDAANLAWKLHEVLVAGAPAELLDTYHRERHPVATSLVAFTGRINTLSTLADGAARRLRNEVLEAAATPDATDWLAARLSLLDVEYGEARAGPPPRVGQRVAPTLVPRVELRWTLAVPAGAGVQSDVQIGRLAVRIVEGLETTLLIRPDGYLAARGVPTDPRAVLSWLCDYALGLEPAGGSACCQ
jgi:2-polyprenyl-6-methoxyphenol hydroxylase-like FAD-dependent oxidoreductase